MNIKSSPYQHQEAYPPIQAAGKNRQYARMLQRNIAAAESETTAVNQYVYQSWMLEKSHPEISSAMASIAMVEMHHLHMLGQMVVLLGGEPRFCMGAGRGASCWNGSMVNYQPCLRQMMINNIKDEQGAIRQYSRQAASICDENVKNLLERIILDEKLHIDCFRRFLQEAPPCQNAGAGQKMF